MMKVSADPNTLAALTAAAAASSFEGPMGRGGPDTSGRLPDFPLLFLEGPAACCLLAPLVDIALEVGLGLILVAITLKLGGFSAKKIAASPNAKSFG